MNLLPRKRNFSSFIDKHINTARAFFCAYAIILGLFAFGNHATVFMARIDEIGQRLNAGTRIVNNDLDIGDLFPAQGALNVTWRGHFRGVIAMEVFFSPRQKVAFIEQHIFGNIGCKNRCADDQGTHTNKPHFHSINLSIGGAHVFL